MKHRDWEFRNGYWYAKCGWVPLEPTDSERSSKQTLWV